MANATVTVQSGGQTESFVIPDAAVERLIPMIHAEYRQHYEGGDEDPTTIKLFAAGLWYHLKYDVLRFERRRLKPDPIDMGSGPDSEK